MSTLDIDAAIGAHTAWHRRFEFIVEGIVQEPLDCQSACDAHLCVLGHWIDGSGREYVQWSKYAQLAEVHIAFHKTACEIARSLDANEIDAAKTLLDGQFAQQSKEIVELLTMLRIEIASRQ
jgi:hypothetical protein